MRDPVSPLSPLARHDLLTVTPGAWSRVLAGRPDLAGIPHLAGWAERGWPVIARRRGPGEDAGLVAAGLPLPPALGKRRIGLALDPGSVTPRPSLTLAEAGGAAPAAWHPTIAALVAHGAAHGCVPRVFGGLLWQALTGLPYLSDTSDLDLLWPVSLDRAFLAHASLDRAFLDGLARIAGPAPMRLDGEICLPDGFAVNWRELHAAGPDEAVLVKGLLRLELRPVAALRAALSPAA
ncbi:malonate decarboxylase holo-[acyl-carrier-protein] synthase [Methylobacterium sp. 37f]|uniref:malonate decarboxylase holo-[acyl-carrier-protein] synthase n=1 Tax=Methylobacterium sp. 37f TaxID=2817058 RepID=UPI001FFC8782